MLTRVAAGLTVAIGAALVVYTLVARVGFTTPLVVTLLLAGVMEIGLAVGVYQKRRAAWAFGLTLSSVSAAALFLAVPAVHRAGTGVMYANIALVAVLAQVVLLILAKDEF